MSQHLHHEMKMYGEIKLYAGSGSPELALRQAGAVIEHVFVLFNYDIYPESRRAYAQSGITLHALATWQDIFSLTKAVNYFMPERAKEIKTFLADPIAWSIAHGGAGDCLSGGGDLP